MILNIKLASLLLVFLCINSYGQKNKRSDQVSLQYGFTIPPISAKPKGYWCLVNGNFDLTQMTKELKEFKDKGMGTLDIWDVAGWVDPDSVEPAGPPFMGDESVQAIAHAIREAGKLGLDIGLTISSSWNAGGSWVKPEDGVMGLFDTSLTVNGKNKISKVLPFPQIPKTFDGIKMLLDLDKNGIPKFYKDVAILAYKVNGDSIIHEVIDISKYYKDGLLNWNVPEGEWKITRYVVTGTGQPLMRPSPNSNGLMIDHFNSDAMRRHLNYFFGKLEAELGDLSKTALKYFYTDSYEANSAAWTVKMPEEFQKRTGYSIVPYLPALKGFVVKDKETTERFLFDFKKTLSDLIIENHYALGKRICNEKGIGFIAEAGGPGPPVHNCPFESLKSLGNLTASRGEFWFDPLIPKKHREELQIIKGPASASHLYNLPRVEAESFTGTQLWQFGPGDLKSTADRAMCEGSNSFVYHTTPHIPREAGIPGWVYNFGTIINTTRAWWPLSNGFHNYIARSSFLLQQGNFVGDVLFYYGDKAPNFAKPKHYIKSLGFGYDYDYINSDIILDKLDVVNHRFVLPHGQSYSILVLPDEITINPDVLEKISYLVKKGGIIVGQKPERSYSLTNYKKNDEKIKILANEMWKNKSEKIHYGKGLIYTDRNELRKILLGNNILPDVEISKKNPQNYFDYIHRTTDNEEIYFIRNITDKVQVYEIKFRTLKGQPQIWNPDNSSITNIPIFSKDKAYTSLPLKLAAYGSMFIVFTKNNYEKNIVNVKLNGDEIFPGTKNVFPIKYINGKTIFEKSGNYDLTYADGSSKTVKINTEKSFEVKGPWEIRFPYGWGAPQRTKFDKLISWTDADDQGIKYFSGIATYYKTFNLDKKQIDKSKRIILDLGEVSKVAKVFLNGKDLGIYWYNPFSIDITEAIKEGKNYLVIDVANVLSNQMTGDSFRKGRNKRTHSNITKGPNAWHTPWQDVPLVKSGILGPVKIKIYKTLKK